MELLHPAMWHDSAGVRAGDAASVGWQVTLCDNDMQAPVAVRCLWTNCYTLPLPFALPLHTRRRRLKQTARLKCAVVMGVKHLLLCVIKKLGT